MELFTWITDFIEVARSVVAVIFLLLIWNIFTGKVRVGDILRFFIPHFGSSTASYSNNDKTFSRQEDEWQEREEEYPITGYERETRYRDAGDYLMNGSISDFDPTNLHHIEAAESLDPYKHE